MSRTETPGVVYVREVAIQYRGPRRQVPATIGHPRDAVTFVRKLVTDHAREHFVAIYLDGRHRPIAHSVVSVGTATSALVHPREVFQAGVLAGAVAVIVLHNHPSGDPAPSREDREIAERLRKAGDILGIRILDSVVWTTDGAFVSKLDEAGLSGRP
jgi:DNA repair protein RadC